MAFTIPQGDHPETWWQIDYNGPFSLWKGHHFVLTGVDTYSGYRFSFPAHNASPKIIICELIEYCIHHHGIPCRIEPVNYDTGPTKELTHAGKYDTGLMIME